RPLSHLYAKATAMYYMSSKKHILWAFAILQTGQRRMDNTTIISGPTTGKLSEAIPPPRGRTGQGALEESSDSQLTMTLMNRFFFFEKTINGFDATDRGNNGAGIIGLIVIVCTESASRISNQTWP